MSTLSGAELFRSIYDIHRSKLHPLVGHAVNLLLARGDISIFEHTENNVGLGRCALAIYDILAQADQTTESRRGAPDFDPEVEEFFDLRTLPDRVGTHPEGVDLAIDTDARELIDTVNYLALCDSIERTEVPLLSPENMPDYDRFSSRVSLDSLDY
jgi:hypothetical protein